MSYVRRGGMALLVFLCALLSQAALHAVWGQAAGASPKKSDTSKCDRTQFRTIVDVGHTVEDPGATSARGVREYEFNLRLATRIARQLTDGGFAKTILLVTAGQAFVSLVNRVERANGLSGDLFLSIHHDSVPERLRETWEYEGKENRFSDRFKGHSIFISYDNGDRGGSLLFARLLGNRLKASGLQYTSHYTLAIMGGRQRELLDAGAGVYRYDQLIVLRAPRMPSVLLEAGLIANRDEELLLASPGRQSLISSAVTEAVEIFCSMRPARKRG